VPHLWNIYSLEISPQFGGKDLVNPWLVSIPLRELLSALLCAGSTSSRVKMIPELSTLSGLYTV
jgi:hypothetical protein